MKIRSLLLGSIAAAGFNLWPGAGGFFDDIPNVVSPGGGSAPRHRSSGGRAHRAWRKRRSSGRS